MATYSNILAGKIPWTEKPGGLQSMGSEGLDMTEHAHKHTLHACTLHLDTLTNIVKSMYMNLFSLPSMLLPKPPSVELQSLIHVKVFPQHSS